MWISQIVSSQHCLLAILKSFKKSADDRNEYGALLTDLSKAFDCTDHKLLIAKLFCFCYGVSPSALIYFTHTYQTELKELRLIIASVGEVA